MDIKEVLYLWFINLLIKKTSAGGIKNENMSNKELAEKLHKPILRKFFKKVYLSFKDNIRGTDLAYMQLVSNFNKGIRFLFCVSNIFSKYVWVVPLK